MHGCIVSPPLPRCTGAKHFMAGAAALSDAGFGQAKIYVVLLLLLGCQRDQGEAQCVGPFYRASFLGMHICRLGLRLLLLYCKQKKAEKKDWNDASKSRVRGTGSESQGTHHSIVSRRFVSPFNPGTMHAWHFRPLNVRRVKFGYKHRPRPPLLRHGSLKTRGVKRRWGIFRPGKTTTGADFNMAFFDPGYYECHSRTWQRELHP